MELAGRVDPEERHAILDRFFQIHAAGHGEPSPDRRATALSSW